MKGMSSWVWVLIGACIAVMCLSYGYVTYKPNMDETKARDANKALADVEFNKEARAQKRLKDAIELVKGEAATWKQITIDQDKTPPDNLPQGGIDIQKDGAQLTVDSYQFHNAIQAAVSRQLKVGGIKLVSQGLAVPGPGQSPSTILAEYYNYPAIPFPVVLFDLGTVTVEGTYEQITANVRAWKNMPHYLAVADGLRIEGTSPHLQGTYSVSIVGFIRGSKLFPTLPEVPGASGSGGPGGGGPGGPGPGGPAGGGKAGGAPSLQHAGV